MSRYDGLIIPRSYSEYINKTDAATLQQALQLSGVLSGAVDAGDNNAVKSSAVNSALTNYINKTDAATLQQALQLPGVLSGAVAAGDNNAVKSSAVNNALTDFYREKNLDRLREKLVGEIYYSSGYWKVALKGFYARPIVIKCIGSSGLYDIAMFGVECSANLIRLGGTSNLVTYKYTKPSENAQMGYLFIKSNLANYCHTIFSLDIYDGGLVETLEESTEEEYNNATAF